MWIYNKDSNKWIKQSDNLSKKDYDNLKQDLSKVKLYSKALSGSNYLIVSDLDNLYESLNYKNLKSWYIDPASSIYSIGTIPSNGLVISKNTLDNFKKEYSEYGFALNNNFTPEHAIEDINLINVDVATTASINLTSKIFTIDGIKLLEGHRVLVKDQISSVDLSISVDPKDYFKGNYYKISNNVSDITYNYYNSENGIYVYTNNNTLSKESFSDYSNYMNLSVNVKQGSINKDKQYSSSRLLNGYYPTEGEVMEFKESHNYLLRHQTDYHNIYENNYLDVLKHGTQSLIIDGVSYIIPERLIYVGDFGVILLAQEGYSGKYLYNDYKTNIKSIIQTSQYYWTCGEKGTILRISKVDLSIKKIDLGDEFNTLTSISFIDDNHGIVVGKYNTIYSTFDGGVKWKKINFNVDNYSYNDVVYYSYSTIFISGDSGLFLELNYSDLSATKWSLKKRTITKYLSSTDKYELIENINDMFYMSFSGSQWGLSYSGSTGSGILNTKDCIFLGTNNGNIIVYGINSFIPEFDFVYLGFSASIGDITSITNQKGTSNVIVSGENSFIFDINNFNTIGINSNYIYNAGTYSNTYITYSNNLFDYEGNTLFSAGNIGVIEGYSYSNVPYSINVENIVPKLPILEYDIARKLNYFDSNYNYRLPQIMTFSNSNGIISSTISSIVFIPKDSTWADYLIDSYQTNAVNSDPEIDETVKPSLIFKKLNNSELILTNIDITNDYSLFNNLYPGITWSSRHTQFTTSAPSGSYTLYIYKHITILKSTYDFCSIGDLLLLSTSDLDTIVMINNIYINGMDYYYYAFNDINQSMVNSIKNGVTIKNLNRYSDYDDFVSNFNNHYISYGYKAENIENQISIYPVFNNHTAYKSLEIDYSLSYDDEYVSTYVGVTGSGYVDGDISVAKIYQPAIVAESNGFLYISEGTPSDGVTYIPPVRVRIRKIDLSTNTVSTIAGLTYAATTGNGGLAVNAALNNPLGVCVTSNGDIYLTEFYGNTIRKIDNATGVITNVLGDGSSVSNGDGGLAINAKTNGPYAIIRDSNDNIYFSEGNKLRLITKDDGKVWTVNTRTMGYGYNYISIDSNDNVYISNGSYIMKYTPTGPTYGNTSPIIGNGTIGFSGENVSATFSINYSAGVAIDSHGNILFGEDNPSPYRRLRKYDIETHLITTIAGGNTYTGDGYPPLQTVIQALGITLDDTDNFYFADYVNSKIKRVKFNFNYNSLYDTDTKFGYMADYNLLDYLSNINSSFNSNKEFYSMPKYIGLPGNNSGDFTKDNIYYDSNSGTTWNRNEIAFGSNLKFEWETLWVNTFVDLYITTNTGVYEKEQILITSKYYNKNIDGYVISFNKKILDINNSSVLSFDIISRNKLYQISEDLKLFDQVNKPYIKKSYQNFYHYDNPIKTKINTDSYSKILTSDGDIKKYLSGIIHTNSDNKLIFNVINVNTTKQIAINNTFNYASSLGLSVEYNKDVIAEQLAFVNFTGGTGSSQELNRSYIGVHSITSVDNEIIVDIPYGTLPTVMDSGYIKSYKFDPFFNYNPINLLDVGIDKMYKVPVKIYENNILKNGYSASLVNYENNKPIFRLTDGLDITSISKKYHWLLEAEITNGIIGENLNGPIWYSGIWESGRWFEGSWYSGSWLSGDWYGGTWSSSNVKDNITTITVTKTENDNTKSIWYSGRWFDGTWNGGTWLDGRRYAGVWQNGLWHNGIWNDGTWNNGEFKGGIWVQGTWNKGVFNSFNRPSYWLDGKFINGDFQNGMWYNGEFGSNYSLLSKFGSLASNSRNATWHGGVFISGNFYSYENISATDSTILPSEVHKYSTWKTGKFNRGNFYGGIVYNMENLSGKWHNGVVKDIQIIGVSSPSESNITLNGIFRFNIGDYINIIGNGTTNEYYNLGNYNNPGRYRIANYSFDLDNEWTTLTLDYNFSTLGFSGSYASTASSNVDTGMRLVSKYKDVQWTSGVWTNGIFEGGRFDSGIWYDGVFVSGEWG